MNRLLFVGIAATVLGGCVFPGPTTQAQLHERAVEFDAQQAAQQAADALTCKPYAAVDADFRHCLDLQAYARNPQLYERAIQQAADAFTCKPYAAIDADFRHCLDLQAQARNLQAQAQEQAQEQANAQRRRQASAEALQQASKSLGDAAHRYQCIGHQNEAFCQ